MRQLIVLIMLVCGSILFKACASDNKSSEDSSTRTLLTSYHGVWSTGKVGELDQLLSKDFVLHFMGGTDYKGIEGAKNAILETRQAFPDWNESVLDVIVDKEKAATRFHSTGTHQGKYGDLDSTGNKVDMLEASIFRVENGKIVEQWAFWDEINFQSQLHAKK